MLCSPGARRREMIKGSSLYNNSLYMCIMYTECMCVCLLDWPGGCFGASCSLFFSFSDVPLPSFSFVHTSSHPPAVWFGLFPSCFPLSQLFANLLVLTMEEMGPENVRGMVLTYPHWIDRLTRVFRRWSGVRSFRLNAGRTPDIDTNEPTGLKCMSSFSDSRQ